MSFPDVLLVKYEVPPGNKHPQCYKDTRGMKGSLEMVYDLTVLTIQYIGPVIIMAYSYSMIALTIWRNTDSGLVQSSQSTIRRNQMIKSKQKVIKMLIVIVTVYTVCYFPINIGWLLLGSLMTLPSATVGYIHTVFLCLALAHTCCNPVIYLGMDKKVRFRFKNIIKSAICFIKCEAQPARNPRYGHTSLASRRHTVTCMQSPYHQGSQDNGQNETTVTEMTVLQTELSSNDIEDS